VPESVQATHTIRHWGVLFRGLHEIAGTITEIKQEAAYYRKQSDTVQATFHVFRGLLLFVRIVTQVFIRDYIIGRFLKAKSELVIKSCIQREITLDSKIA
jgi:hypothetical protein